MSVSSYTPGPEMALMSQHQQEMINNNQRPQRSSYFDDTRSSVSEFRPAPAGQFRSPGSVYSISGPGDSISGSGAFRGERPAHGPDLGRHSALTRTHRSRVRVVKNLQIYVDVLLSVLQHLDESLIYIKVWTGLA